MEEEKAAAQETEAAPKKVRKKSTFLADFKAFLSRGNVIDLAVAVIIGAAFGKIVSSLVNDIIMPLVSLALGGVSFADLKWVIRPGDELLGVTETALGYGMFIQATIDFLIIAFCVFMIIRFITKMQQGLKEVGSGKKKGGDAAAEATPAVEAPAASPAPTQEELLGEIRDLLKAQSGDKKGK